VDGQTEQDFIDAFRRVVDIFRSEDAHKVKFEYNVNNKSGGGNSFLGQYPGDEYVDFMGMDGYNWGTGAEGWVSHWQDWDEVFESAYSAIAKKKKPIIVSEYGSGEPGGDKAEWLRKSWETLRTSGRYGLVKAMIYFDQSGYKPDFQLDTSAESRAAYNEAIAFESDGEVFASGDE
jgi:mannan endo-1,4-beta-mannosidase